MKSSWLVVAGMAMVLPAAALAQANDPGLAQPVSQSPRRPTAQQARAAADQSQRDDAIARRRRVGWVPPRAAVRRDGTHWIGPAYGNRELQLDHPWRKGRFARGIGADYVWQFQGGARERFQLGGGWFALAPADYDRAGDWRWSNDAVVLYPDPAHDGWYRAYNVRLQTYTHVQYLGD